MDSEEEGLIDSQSDEKRRGRNFWAKKEERIVEAALRHGSIAINKASKLKKRAASRYQSRRSSIATVLKDSKKLEQSSINKIIIILIVILIIMMIVVVKYLLYYIKLVNDDIYIK